MFDHFVGLERKGLRRLTNMSFEISLGSPVFAIITIFILMPLRLVEILNLSNSKSYESVTIIWLMTVPNACVLFLQNIWNREIHTQKQL